MRGRALGLLGALLLGGLLVGGGLGWLWAEDRSEPVTSSAAPRPVAVADPPLSGAAEVSPDSDLPPLGEGIVTHDELLGTPEGEGVVVPVPDGWERRVEVPDREAVWTEPGDPAGAYSLRVRILEDEVTLGGRVAQRRESLGQDPALSDVEVLSTSGDTLQASFVNRGYRRLVVVRWVSFQGGIADVEVAAAGRGIDRAGLEELVARAASGVRRQVP